MPNTLAQRERAVENASNQSASDMYFRARVYSVLRIIFIGALIGIGVALALRYT